MEEQQKVVTPPDVRMVELLRETANATPNFTIDKEGNWKLNIGNYKEPIVNASLKVVFLEAIEFIEKNRKSKEPSIRSPKPYTI